MILSESVFQFQRSSNFLYEGKPLKDRLSVGFFEIRLLLVKVLRNALLLYSIDLKANSRKCKD